MADLRYAAESKPWGRQHLRDRAVGNADEVRDFTRRYAIGALDGGGLGAGPGGAGVLVDRES
jgi:hypothetical protein